MVKVFQGKSLMEQLSESFEGFAAREKQKVDRKKDEFRNYLEKGALDAAHAGQSDAQIEIEEQFYDLATAWSRANNIGCRYLKDEISGKSYVILSGWGN